MVIITSGFPGSTDSGLIPPEVLHYPLPSSFSELSARVQTDVIAQLAVLAGARHVIVVDENLIESTMQLDLRDRTDPVFWAHTTLGDLTTFQRRTDSGRAPHLIAESQGTAARIIEDGGAAAADVRVLVTPPLPVVPEFESVSQYTAAYDDVDFDESHPFRVLWRTTADDEETRTALLSGIRSMIAEHGLPVRVHVHREVGLDTVNSLSARDPRSGDLLDFTGGLRDVPTENYHAMIVDTASAGARASMLQAMLLGLPVIAGSRVDDILDETTSIVANDADPTSFVDAVTVLISSRDLRRRLIREAYGRVRSIIDRDPFSDAVAREFGLV